MFELTNYKDVDSTVAQLVSRYYSLRDAGNYNEAYNLIETNKTLLSKYFINAESINKIELGIYELAQQLYFNQKIIVSKTEPNPQSYQMNIGSEWLQEYV